MPQSHASSGYELNKPVPYTLQVDQELLNITKQKLHLARFPEEQDDVADDDWSQGTKVKVVRDLANYWKDGYDWRAEEDRINAEFTQFKAKIDIPGYGLQILHFAHQRSTRVDAWPLLIAHGWPGSFLESRKIIQSLTEPSSPSSPAFHLVIPSIPGYGPGDPPAKTGFGPVTTARAFNLLMVNVLGYERYFTHGGDWGAFITRSMAMQYPHHVCAQHLTFVPIGPPPWYKHPFVMGRLVLNYWFYSAADRKALERLQYYLNEQSGYLKQQSTRPQSLGFGLGDSPIGLLGWFVEKYHEWMDVAHYDMPTDETLAFVMMHWMQGATPGLRYYKAAYTEKDASCIQKAFTVYIDTPTGVSHFPMEVISPRDWVAAVANIQFWKDHETGGHFPSVECPKKLVEDIREFFSMDVVRSAMVK